MAKHYSPRTILRISGEDGLFDDMYEAVAAGQRVAGVWFDRGGTPRGVESGTGGRLIRLPADPDRAAAALYDTLHQLDNAGLDLILVELPPETPEWAAVRDRLTRAAGA
jgi:L-threonylcarbamoyladenylate synthase